jgi:glycosyltransferase involved in cell wall biosynthesis
MQAGLVTVMIPSYNYARFLTECIESAVSQERVDVAVVDNGSTDESPEIAERLAEQHANVRFIRYEDNRGIITSFNRCREEIRGEYAVLLCADDCLTPGSIARSTAFMDRNPNVGLVYGLSEFIGQSANGLAVTSNGVVRPPIVYEGDRWVERLCRTGLQPILTPEALMRSSVLEKVGPHEERCPYTSDVNLWLRMAAVSDVAFLPGATQALFRLHDANHGLAYPHSSAAELTQRWQAFAAFFETLGDDPRRAGWERLARRRVGREARYSATRAFVRDGDANEGEAERLLAVAEELDPTGSISDRAGWALRRRLGPTGSRYFPGFLPRPTVNRLRRIAGERRRLRSGVA